MITPTSEELETQVRDFIQRIPRRRSLETEPGPSGHNGYPWISDGVRTMALDSGEIPSTSFPGAPEATQPTSGTDSSHYSFQIVDASALFNNTPTVLVFDGLVNDELPEGMGGDDYFLPAHDGMEIWLIVAYDTDTFEINSRTLAVDTGDNSAFGVLYILLGGAAVTTDGQGNTTVDPYNAHCGDVNFTLDVGALDGLPAIKATPKFGDWTQVPSQ